MKEQVSFSMFVKHTLIKINMQHKNGN